MTIARKLLLSISLTLAVAFVALAAINSLGFSRNSRQLVEGVAERLQLNNRTTAESLHQNAQAIATDLQQAEETTRGIILDLYNNSFNTLLSAMSNQIFPMIENFDFDSPRRVVEKIMAANSAIAWIQLTTAEKPGKGDVISFGTRFDDDDRLNFSTTRKGDFAFLRIDMQVSLAGMQALGRVSDTFGRVSRSSHALAEDIATRNGRSLADAEGYARQIGAREWARMNFANLTTMAVALVVVCLFLSLLVRRLVANPLGATVRMIEELEKGHIDSRLNLKRSDEIGRMSRALDGFADNLQHEVVANLQRMAEGDLAFRVTPRDGRDMLRGSLLKLCEDMSAIMAQIRTAGEQVSAGGNQIADASQSLSHGASRQAASLEEVSATMNGINGRTGLYAENAAQASNLAGEARSLAEHGNQRMREMTEAMAKIRAGANSIGKIIKVIDDIAFQTNLLALNAAVEAAHAGQHGKGFAVVAEEVRNLAARSAQAARETSELINTALGTTEEGARIAGQTAQALEGIVAGVGRVADLVDGIARAGQEQVGEIALVNDALNQIGEITQQNSANAEEGAAAAEELSGQAGMLKDLLARFQLQEGRG